MISPNETNHLIFTTCKVLAQRDTTDQKDLHSEIGREFGLTVVASTTVRSPCIQFDRTIYRVMDGVVTSTGHPDPSSLGVNAI
jgi:hypothetical protein